MNGTLCAWGLNPRITFEKTSNPHYRTKTSGLLVTRDSLPGAVLCKYRGLVALDLISAKTGRISDLEKVALLP